MSLDINPRKLGFLNLEGFVSRPEVNKDHLKLAFIAGGQGGGKITSEFVRLGYPAVMYNTCLQDLQDIDKVLKNVENADYKLIRFKGYDGASKDRDMGMKAARDNVQLLKDELITNEYILDSDFTWIVVSLGGGTGNGSVSFISQIVSGIMRADKRYMKKVDENGEIIDYGKPTVGIIAAIPEADSEYKIEENAALALEEIQILQKEGLIGSVLLVDNEKLISDFLKMSDEETKNIDWVTTGNCTVAQHLTELALLTCLPGRETFDKSEYLDVCSTSGFLTLGKFKVKSNYLDELKKLANSDSNSSSEVTEQDIIDLLIKDTFEKQNVFADDYNFNTAVHGALAILTPRHDKVVTVRHALMMKKALKKALNSNMVAVTHFGVFENDVYGTLRKVDVRNDEAIIYTMAVTLELPKRVLAMTERALENKKKSDEKKAAASTKISELLKNSTTVEKKDVKKLDLDSIMKNNLIKASKEAAAAKNEKPESAKNAILNLLK